MVVLVLGFRGSAGSRYSVPRAGRHFSEDASLPGHSFAKLANLRALGSIFLDR